MKVRKEYANKDDINKMIIDIRKYFIQRNDAITNQ